MLNNWITNNKMKDLLKYISVHPNTEELKLNVKELYKLLSPPFKKVNDCIIISEESIDKLQSTFDNAVEVYMDKTGYESSNTETRINCYFENKISMIAGTQIALITMETWALKLKHMDPNSKFCLIICSDEDYVEIRFHKVRYNEIMFLSENLEDYEDGAVGYIIV